MKNRNRLIAEIKIEDIFLSTSNSHVLVDYNDIRTIRRNHTLRFQYNLQVNQIDSWRETVKKEISLSEMSYCALEIAYGKEMTTSSFHNLMNTIYKILEGLPILNCSHMTDNLTNDDVVVNLYFFSPKSDEDYNMDKRIEKILENYRIICSPYVYIDDCEATTETVDGEVLLLDLTQPELDGDSRLSAYTGVISQLTVNDDSAIFIKEMVDEAVRNLEQDIQKGKTVQIPTIQNFVFYAGNLWIHLEGYYTKDELKPTALKWSKIMYDLRVSPLNT